MFLQNPKDEQVGQNKNLLMKATAGQKSHTEGWKHDRVASATHQRTLWFPQSVKTVEEVTFSHITRPLAPPHSCLSFGLSQE